MPEEIAETRNLNSSSPAGETYGNRGALRERKEDRSLKKVTSRERFVFRKVESVLFYLSGKKKALGGGPNCNR